MPDSEKLSKYGCTPEYSSLEEWLKDRDLRGIGASESSAFFGVHPYLSAAEILLRKAGKLERAPADPKLALRRAMEAGIFQAYLEQTGRRGTLHRGQKIQFRNSAPFILATPDANVRVETPRDHLRLVELKTTTKPLAAWDDGPPLYYQIQVQQQMFCTGAARCDLAVLFLGPDLDFKVYEYEASPWFFEILEEKLSAAWDLVQRMRNGESVEMPTTGKIDDRVLARFCPPKPSTVAQLGEQDLRVAESFLFHRSQASAYEKIATAQRELAEGARVRLLAAAKGADLLTFQGSQVRLQSKLVKRAGYQVGPSERIDLKPLKEESDA